MNWTQEFRKLAIAVGYTLLIVVLAGLAVEVVNHTGIVTGLGFTDQVARAIADASTFALTGVLLYLVWCE